MCKEPKLSREIMKDLEVFLFPSFTIERERLNLISQIFEDKPKIPRMIDYSGATDVFIANMVRVLKRYGADGGEHVIVTLLKGVVDELGEDQEEKANELIKRMCGEEYELKKEADKYTIINNTHIHGNINSGGGDINVAGTMNKK